MLRPALLVSLLLVTSACPGSAEAPKDGKADAPATKPDDASPVDAARADAHGPALVGAAAAVDGVPTWVASPDAGFTVSVPGGDDWVAERSDISNVHSDKLGVTIMLQHQAGIESDRLDEYVKMVSDSNKRDAPKYSEVAPVKGSLAGQPAARVDGEFDNGKAFATRDYLVIGPRGASALMVRGPKTDAARVHAIADHLAATYAP